MVGVGRGAQAGVLVRTAEALESLAKVDALVVDLACGSGALGLAAALTGRLGTGPIVAIVSGGNIDLAKYCAILEGSS